MKKDKGIHSLSETSIVKTDKGVTIKFDEVKPSKDKLKVVHPLKALENRVSGCSLESWSEGIKPLVDVKNTHQFVAAVHTAFSSHYPLILTPDAVWIAIAQGFSMHVNENSESLRKKFSLPEGKTKIEVVRDDFKKGGMNPWLDVFSEFSTRIGEHVGEIQSTLVADFSTTTPIAKAVSEITIMDSFQNFFDYAMRTMCGIPEIHLRGTQQDWERVKQKALDLKQYDLDWWIPSLTQILDQFIDAYRSDKLTQESLEFWCSIYKFKGGSGGPYVNGWINVFLPYLKCNSKSGKKYTQNKYVSEWKSGWGNTFGGGPHPTYIPTGMSMAPFVWKYFSKEYQMQFHGGFVGVSQDPDSLAVEPELGWIVGELNTVS